MAQTVGGPVLATLLEDVLSEPPFPDPYRLSASFIDGFRWHDRRYAAVRSPVGLHWKEGRDAGCRSSPSSSLSSPSSLELTNDTLLQTLIIFVFSALSAAAKGAGGSTPGMLKALIAYRFLLGVGIGASRTFPSVSSND